MPPVERPDRSRSPSQIIIRVFSGGDYSLAAPVGFGDDDVALPLCRIAAGKGDLFAVGRYGKIAPEIGGEFDRVTAEDRNFKSDSGPREINEIPVGRKTRRCENRFRRLDDDDLAFGQN